MAGKQEKPEDIDSKLRQVEVLQGQGMTVADAVRQIGVTQQTYYRWRKLYGGMGRTQLKRLKELEKENQRLRRAVSDLTLDKLILTEAARGNVWSALGVQVRSSDALNCCVNVSGLSVERIAPGLDAYPLPHVA
ncbi:Transposase [Aliiruegeria lutimaris]|uniref:Transposase n=1 Tax=Aliiruegeria lutimaris TaxID=571298 RepID=A0A1G9QL38_9RHOB|nr:Transposase [Aliiruegeria lutimaris]